MYKTFMGTVLVVSIIASRVHAAPEGYVRGQEQKSVEVQQEAPLPKPAEAQQEAPLPKPTDAQQEAPVPKPAEVLQLNEVSVKLDKNKLAMNSKDKIEKDEKPEYAESEIEKLTLQVSADLYGLLELPYDLWCRITSVACMHNACKLVHAWSS